MSIAILRKNVKDAILAKINEAIATGTLTDVKNVLYGHRAKAAQLNNPPLIWVLPAAHTPEQVTMRSTEHNFNFDFLAVIKNVSDPEQAAELAEDLSSRIYDVIVSDSKLGGVVQDIIPTEVQPAFETQGPANTQLYWASVSFSFRVRD